MRMTRGHRGAQNPQYWSSDGSTRRAASNPRRGPSWGRKAPHPGVSHSGNHVSQARTPHGMIAAPKVGGSEGMCASRVQDGGRRGWIVPIGGAEDKENSPQILRRFVELAGGAAADIAVIPTASLVRETGPRYERLFGEMGARSV